MILPLIFLIFLRLQCSISTSNHSSFIYGQWFDDHNAIYQNTLHNLLETLSSQTSTNLYILSTTLSKTPNQLHGLYTCRPDIDPQTCHSCINSAKNYILKHFAYSSKGLVWYDNCMMRYSNESFFGKWKENSSSASFWTQRKVEGSYILFTRILMKTMKSLAIEASKAQGMNKYASKVVNISRNNESLYARVQCTPDLLARDCYRCLRLACQKLLNMKGNVGGQVLYTSCMVEYKTTLAYNNSTSDLGIVSLPSTPSIEDNNSTLISV